MARTPYGDPNAESIWSQIQSQSSQPSAMPDGSNPMSMLGQILSPAFAEADKVTNMISQALPSDSPVRSMFDRARKARRQRFGGY